MLTADGDTWLIIAFFAVLVPSTGLLVRYAWQTRFWSNEAGKAFFLILLTAWINYTITLYSVYHPAWAAEPPGLTFRIISRFLIAAALVYAWWVYERARHNPEREGKPGAGFTGDPRTTPSGGIPGAGS